MANTENISSCMESERIMNFTQPNEKTIVAMREAERIAHDPSVKCYANVDEALEELRR